jgi:putative addiction module component (TIGR02574 family)
VNEILELRSLPAAERLKLIDELWDSIVDDQETLADTPEVVAELRQRRDLFMSNPASGIAWAEAKAIIRSRRA